MLGTSLITSDDIHVHLGTIGLFIKLWDRALLPQRHVGRPVLHNIALDPCLLPKGGPPLLPEDTPPLCLSIRALFIVIPNAVPFIWIHILFIFTGGELDPTHGPFQRLSLSTI